MAASLGICRQCWEDPEPDLQREEAMSRRFGKGEGALPTQGSVTYHCLPLFCAEHTCGLQKGPQMTPSSQKPRTPRIASFLRNERHWLVAMSRLVGNPNVGSQTLSASLSATPKHHPSETCLPEWLLPS